MRYLLVFMILLLHAAIFAGFSLDLESGIAISGYNDVRIPGSGESTKFSFTEDLKSDNTFVYRLHLHYMINERHRISLLYAPLTIEPKGSIDREVLFQNVAFPAGEELSGLYRFDSYRLNYRYYFRNQKMLFRALGATVKLRDAEIALETENLSAKKTNTGFVPIINFLFAYDLNADLELSLDGDALWSPYGRAFDLLLSLKYRVNDNFALRGGYRILEGGSDGDEVYTFALINYLVLGLQGRF